jgi:predicted ribosomally synthesized peptide with SipW-like signal peptide
MAIIAGMTWALFTDTQTISNHLRAGDLQVTLKRTELIKTTIDDNGYLTTLPTDTTVVDFTDPTDKNVFGLKTGNDTVVEKIVPGSKFVATMQVENNSDVAFKYWAGISCKDADAVKELAGQLIIIVYTDENGDGVIDTEGDDAEKHESIVSSGLIIGDDTNYIGLLEKTDKESFIVSVEFNDNGYTYENGVLTSVNDAAQKQEVEFDLVVYAVQVTTAITTP